MTSPIDTAHVLILPDLDRFDDAAKSGITGAMRDAQQIVQRILSNIEADFRRAGDELGDGLQRGGEQAEDALQEVGRSADRALDSVQREADQAGDDLANEFQRGGERAEDALDEIGDAAERASRQARDEFGRFSRKAKVDLGEVGDKGEREFDRIEREAKDAGRGMSGSFRRAAGLMVAAFAAVQIGQFIKNAVLAADDLADAMGVTAQVIQQTEGAAGLLTEQVREMSRALSLEIGVDSAQVQATANILLTFDEISSEVFERSLHAAADLTTVFGTDLRGASIQLGKALQDPVRGVTALSRAGVPFNEAQREMIKNLVESGDLLGAQNLILEEIEGQVGGTAAVVADSWQIVTNMFREAQRALGEALIPALDAVAPALIGLAEAAGPLLGSVGEVLGGLVEQAAPIVEVLGVALGEGLAALLPAVEPVGAAFLALVEALAPLLPVVGELLGTLLPPLASIVEALAEPLSIVAEIVADTLTQALAILEPHLPLIVDLFGQFAVVLAENLQETLPIVAELLLELLTAMVPLIPDLVKIAEAMLPLMSNSDGMVLVLTLLSQLILLTVLPSIEALSALLTGDFANAFPIVSMQIQLWAGLVGGLVNFVRDQWEAALNRVAGIIGFFRDQWNDAVARVVAIGGVVAGIIGFVRDQWTAALNRVGGIIRFFRDQWNDAVNRVIGIARRVTEVAAILRNAFGNAVSGVRDRIGALVGVVRGLPGRISSAIGNLARLLFNKGQAVIQGLIDGIRNKLGALADIASTAVDVVSGLFPGSPAKRGPFSGRGAPELRGQRIGGDLAAGIAAATPAVTAAAGAFVNALAAGLPTGPAASFPVEPGSLLAAQPAPAAAAGGDLAPLHVRVYIGERELTDIVRVEVDSRNRQLRRRVTAGTGAAR